MYQDTPLKTQSEVTDSADTRRKHSSEQEGGLDGQHQGHKVFGKNRIMDLEEPWICPGGSRHWLDAWEQHHAESCACRAIAFGGPSLQLQLPWNEQQRLLGRSVWSNMGGFGSRRRQLRDYHV